MRQLVARFVRVARIENLLLLVDTDSFADNIDILDRSSKASIFNHESALDEECEVTFADLHLPV